MGNQKSNWLSLIFSPSSVGVDFFIGGVCILGDKIMGTDFAASNDWFRALTDNATHAAVAMLSWAVVVDLDLRRSRVVEMLLCAFMAGIIDIDHFIAAGSFNLKAATSLKSRPPFHMTMLVPTVSLLTYYIQKLFNTSTIPQLHWMVVVAGLSHHIRDGSRRGLWMWPLWNIPAYPKWAYITLVMALPFMVKGAIHVGGYLKSPVRAKSSDTFIEV